MYPNQQSFNAPRPIGFESMSYPGQSPYPPQQGGSNQPGYPPAGYPSQQPGGYPAYPPQQQQAGGYPSYPTQQAGGYPQQSGYPPQQGGYPQQQGGYPPQQGGYPPQQQGGYPPQQQGGYPPQQGGYPPQQQQQQQQYGQYPAGGVGGMAQSQCQGTVRTVPGASPTADAEVLRKAMKGLGCNDTAVIGVLCARSNPQRQQIALAFKTMYGKDLIKELRGELRGDFEELILALMETPARYDAHQLRKAMEGLGTKESVLIEIMCTRTNEQIREIKTQYRAMFGRDLEHDLGSETSGHFKRLLVSMSVGGRDESNNVDPRRAHMDADALYKAGEKRLGTDESTFNSILAAQNPAQLRAVFAEYEKIARHGIERAIESEFSGDVKDGLLTVIKCAKNRPGYFAECLQKSMVGLGTRDTDLIRCVVTRCEIDMVQIKQEFQRMYNRPLEAMIQGDCSGSYKNGLIALVKGN